MLSQGIFKWLVCLDVILALSSLGATIYVFHRIPEYNPHQRKEEYSLQHKWIIAVVTVTIHTVLLFFRGVFTWFSSLEPNDRIIFFLTMSATLLLIPSAIVTVDRICVACYMMDLWYLHMLPYFSIGYNTIHLYIMTHILLYQRKD